MERLNLLLSKNFIACPKGEGGGLSCQNLHQIIFFFKFKFRYKKSVFKYSLYNTAVFLMLWNLL